ncbi:MAG: DNA translocase FtsK [Eubacterium sp.]|nr:DNA translocase FtsK [Eubacterium sp.]
MADKNSSPGTSFKYEVILWAVLALSIILFISNFGIAGKAGNFISSIFFGLFGFTAYIFPFLLFGGTAFAIANRDNTVAVIKETAAAGFFIFVCMFLELIGSKAGTPVESYLWAVEHKYGGGLIGGLLTWLIQSNLGTISAYVIDIIMMIICMVLMTQRSLWKPIQSGGRKMYASARNETIRQREQYTQRRQRRIDNKVTGVSSDTSIKAAGKQKASDNLNEIRPDPAFTADFPIHMMNQPPKAVKEREPDSAYAGIPKTQAAGMEYSDVMLFPPDMEKEPKPKMPPDNIVPIKNRKVALKPSMPETGNAGAADGHAVPEPDFDAADESAVPQNLYGDVSNDSAGTDLEDLQHPDAYHAAPDAGFEMHGDAASGNDTASAEVIDFESMDFFGVDFEQAPGQHPQPESSVYETADSAAGSQPKFTLDEAAGMQAMAGREGSSQLESILDDDLSQDDISLPAMTAEELMDQQLQQVKTAPVKAAAPSAAQRQPAANPSGTAAPLHRNPKQSQAEIASNTADISVQMHRPQPVFKKEHVLPSVSLLKNASPNQTGDSREHLQETALKLQQTLKNFGVNVTILNVSCGPSVTRYEIQPEMGVKVSKIVNLADDIKLNLAAADIRIEAPIPGKAAIGIEVPNKETVPVMFRELIESEAFQKQSSPCAFAAGKDIAGQVVVTDICKMPHLLIAGATGSGKSVCINTIIMSILYKADPDDVKLIMIDPKVVELSVYNGIPHLLLPVVTDPKKAAGALHWAVSEMMDRYQKFADYGVRDMKGYNAKVKKIADIPDESKPQKMPYIVIIVDELADLMMAAPGDVEDAICRLAQLARAAGIHLIIATQRPSVNVITGLIKANMPSRIAFSVTSGIDSRTILDMNGAEKLLGKGDMLFYPQGLQKPVRVQGAFVSDSEVSDVVEFLTSQSGAAQYSSEIEQKVASAASAAGSASSDAASGDDRDVYFADAARLLMEKEKASVSMLQRYFKIGFNRAARIMDQLEEAGVVGPEEGTKPRKILMSPEQFAQYEEEVL